MDENYGHEYGQDYPNWIPSQSCMCRRCREEYQQNVNSQVGRTCPPESGLGQRDGLRGKTADSQTEVCRHCGVLPEYGHMDWCKIDRAPTAQELAKAVIAEEERSVGYDGPSATLVGMAKAYLDSQSDTAAEPKR